MISDKTDIGIIITPKTGISYRKPKQITELCNCINYQLSLLKLISI